MGEPCGKHRVARLVRVAAESCPALATRQISPHVIRHTTAMHLLQASVDITVFRFGAAMRVRQLRIDTLRPI